MSDLWTLALTVEAAPVAAEATVDSADVKEEDTSRLIEDPPSSALFSSLSVCDVPDVLGLPA